MILDNEYFNRLPMTGWYPGHMLKAGRQMQEALRLVDLVVELVDARAPLATRNPILRRLLDDKPFLMVVNKSDLADPQVSKKWDAWYQQKGIQTFFLDSQKVGNVRGLTQIWRHMVIEARKKRGATRPLMRPVRLMIVGIPNIGKSTLVNRLHEKNKAQMGPKPGVTRQTQWIVLSDDVELLDTPGVMWPKVRNKCHELLLTVLGNIRDEVMGVSMPAEFLAWQLLELNREEVWSALGLKESPHEYMDILHGVAERRGLLQKGGGLDLERASVVLLKEFRDGHLGRTTFEFPPCSEDAAVV